MIVSRPAAKATYGAVQVCGKAGLGFMTTAL